MREDFDQQFLSKCFMFKRAMNKNNRLNNELLFSSKTFISTQGIIQKKNE
jgi:hypothetical protein